MKILRYPALSAALFALPFAGTAAAEPGVAAAGSAGDRMILAQKVPGGQQSQDEERQGRQGDGQGRPDGERRERGDRGGERSGGGDRGGDRGGERAGGGDRGGDRGGERAGGGDRGGDRGGERARDRGPDPREQQERARREAEDNNRRAQEAEQQRRAAEEARRAGEEKARRDAAEAKQRADQDAARRRAEEQAAQDKAARERQLRDRVGPKDFGNRDRREERRDDRRDVREDRRDGREERRDDRRDVRDERRDGREERRDDRRDMRNDHRDVPTERREVRDDRRDEIPRERRIESFRDRFRARINDDDRAFKDMRRGREERIRERAQRREFRGIDDLKSRRQVREEGGRRIIVEPDRRRIIRDGNRMIIRSDEQDRISRRFRDVRREKRNGRDVTIALGLGGVHIYTEFDDDGRPRRRWRRGADGRDIVLFDNSRSARWGRRHGRGNGGYFDAIIDLPPPRLRIPREDYIVDYDRASDDDLYETLTAPPVEEIDEGYSIDEIRSSYSLRDRMRRIDLDTINFEFGSWELLGQDYDKLERVARAMRRVLRRNSDEVFLVEGHTDAVGADEDNLTLSDRRAEEVARILTEEFDIPAENLMTQGYGEQFLKIYTQRPERQNRRVAVRRITPLLAR